MESVLRELESLKDKRQMSSDSRKKCFATVFPQEKTAMTSGCCSMHRSSKNGEQKTSTEETKVLLVEIHE